MQNFKFNFSYNNNRSLLDVRIKYISQTRTRFKDTRVRSETSEYFMWIKNILILLFKMFFIWFKNHMDIFLTINLVWKRFKKIHKYFIKIKIVSDCLELTFNTTFEFSGYGFIHEKRFSYINIGIFLIFVNRVLLVIEKYLPKYQEKMYRAKYIHTQGSR